MTTTPHILICDDDSTFHLALKHVLKKRYKCTSAYNGDEALAILRNQSVDLLLLDVNMREENEGLRYLPRLKEADPAIEVVMSSGRTDFATVREAMRLGAADYIPKDFDPHELEHTVERVLEKRSLKRRAERQDYEVSTNQSRHRLVGASRAVEELRRLIERIARSPANVVITGETGTGKEVVARQLRKRGPDGSLEPFVAVDSSTIQSSMAESLLFGHEKGAFTGAERAARGIFEEAHGGVVYFDEIANMPLNIQAKLLRVLQEKEVTRLGSSKAIQLEFRVICATNRDLEKMAAAGEFKDDLLQRLNVIPVRIPPLRERKEDIPLLVAHFAELHAPGRGLRFADEALALLAAYDWPGNVRELGNVVAYVTAMSDGPVIEPADLPPKFRDLTGMGPAAAAGAGGDQGNFYEQVESFERRILKEAYERCGGNVSRIAMELGMDRSHLHGKLKHYGIHQPRRGD